MNQDQFSSFARWLLNAISGGVIAYTASKSDSAKGVAQFISQLVTGPDALAGVVLGITWLWGHLTHKNETANLPPPQAGSSKTSVYLLIGLLSLGALAGTACHTTPQQVTYQSAAATTVTVEVALRAYNVFAAQGKTTIAQNRQVKAAYEKYQAAFAVVCDAGQIYAATGGTNAPAASLALQAAVANASASQTDIIKLVQSFGVKL